MKTLDPKVSRKIAQAGARRLAKLVQTDGRFIYQYQPGPPIRISSKYNVLRHCGAVWALFDVGRMVGTHPEVREAAARAGRYITPNFVRPFGAEGGLCVVDSGKIKLGGSGLALLALTSLSAATGDPQPLDTARAIGRYILDQWTDHGDFIHSRSFPAGEILPFRSQYYTGEAVFGLLALYRATGEDVWRDAAFTSLRELAARGYGVRERHHWMLYALDMAHEIQPSPEIGAYARRIADAIVGNTTYRNTGASTPSACMSEALVAYLRMARRISPTGLGLAPYARTLHGNFALQLRSLRPDGSFVRGGGRTDVRIDFIQHNISAFAGYSVLSAAEGGRGSRRQAG